MHRELERDILMLRTSVRLFVFAMATDVRRSFDILAEMTRTVLVQDPFSGHLFVFVNRPRDRGKLQIGIEAVLFVL